MGGVHLDELAHVRMAKRKVARSKPQCLYVWLVSYQRIDANNEEYKVKKEKTVRW